MSNAPVAQNRPTDDADFNASVEAAAAACGGDVREAVWELLLRNAWLEAEVERLNGSVSRGYPPAICARECGWCPALLRRHRLGGDLQEADALARIEDVADNQQFVGGRLFRQRVESGSAADLDADWPCSSLSVLPLRMPTDRAYQQWGASN